MTGFFIQAMQQHFANPESIMHDSFRSRAWSKVVCDSGIGVIDGSVWDPTKAGQQPQIVVRRGKWTPIRTRIGDSQGLTNEGQKRYSTGMRGTHTIFGTASAGPEAEILGAEIYLYLLTFAPAIRQYFNLLRCVLLEVGEISILEEARTVYAVPVTLAYAWEESWIVHEHAPLLKRFQLSTLIPGAQ